MWAKIVFRGVSGSYPCRTATPTFAKVDTASALGMGFFSFSLNCLSLRLWNSVKDLTLSMTSKMLYIFSLLAQQKYEMAGALKSHRLLREKGAALKTSKDLRPEAFSHWEDLFIQNLSPLPVLMERLHTVLNRISTALPPFLMQEEDALKKKP